MPSLSLLHTHTPTPTYKHIHSHTLTYTHTHSHTSNVGPQQKGSQPNLVDVVTGHPDHVYAQTQHDAGWVSMCGREREKERVCVCEHVCEYNDAIKAPHFTTPNRIIRHTDCTLQYLIAHQLPSHTLTHTQSSPRRDPTTPILFLTPTHTVARMASPPNTVLLRTFQSSWAPMKSCQSRPK
jgi:hypothetical protein